MTFSRGRFTKSISEEIPEEDRSDDGFLVILKPSIFSDSNSDTGEDDSLQDGEVRYAEDQVVVWVVEEATAAGDLLSGCTLSGIANVTFPPIAVYPDRNEFRTCFTLWRYDDSSDRFFIGSEEVGIGAFEEGLEQIAKATAPDLSKLTVSIYNPRRSGLSVFRLD